jgi:hypothetical protein
MSYTSNDPNSLRFMSNLFVQEVIGECIKAPSKASIKKISECKNRIEEGFDFMWEHGLHDYSFLPAPSNTYETIMQDHFRNRSPLKRINSISEADIKRMQNGEDPLIIFESMYDSNDDEEYGDEDADEDYDDDGASEDDDHSFDFEEVYTPFSFLQSMYDDNDDDEDDNADDEYDDDDDDDDDGDDDEYSYDDEEECNEATTALEA